MEELQKKEWARPPVDDVGYTPSIKMLAMGDDELKTLVEKFRITRYTGWRNYEDKWRKYMGLDDTTGKTIVDFGCGVGIESLELALNGNKVIAADIVPENVELTRRIVNLYGKDVQTKIISWCHPYIDLSNQLIDILYMNGVLHHIPYAYDLIKESLKWLKPSGEIRAMLYSDRGWAKYTKSSVPPFDSDVTKHPLFNKFLRVFDRVGYHADWYSRERLEWRFGDLVNVTSYDYITNDDRYCVARMTPKS
jgi:SAM-dependent methyltransferase